MTKIDIFSGFLGAGKTTLIKKLLAEAYSGEKVVLIENEFGQIGIDSGFLKESGVQITEMNQGCICCSLVGDFGKALHEVLTTYTPDRILIEPSGVGKLSDVIRAVQGVTEDGSAVLNSATVVVDAGKCKLYMRNFGEFFNDQVESAGCIVLSHTDNIAEDKLATAISLLREHNATATIVTTPWSSLDGAQLLTAMEKRNTLEDVLKELEHEHHEHGHHHHHHHDGECDDPDCCCHEHHHHDDHDEHHEHKHGHHHHHHHDGECDDPDCCCHEHHHHDHDDHDDHDDHGHHHHHHHDGECDDPDCCCHEHHHHHHDDHDDHGHHHHHHHHHDGECDDPDCCCHEHHHHEHDECDDPNCSCHEHGHRHGHHHAADVFTSWGIETARKYTVEGIREALEALDETRFGTVLRAKGIVAAEDGSWIHFDYVPGEPDIRTGAADITGRLCVIGAGLDKAAIAALFGAEA